MLTGLEKKAEYQYVLKAGPDIYFYNKCFLDRYSKVKTHNGGDSVTDSGDDRDAEYLIPLTGSERYDPALLTGVSMEIACGFKVVNSRIPPDLVSFFVCRDGAEHIDHDKVWETHDSELRALGVPHYLDEDDAHPPGKCCSVCNWPASKLVIQKFAADQAKGNFSYAIAKDHSILELNFDPTPCVYFRHLSVCPELNWKTRSDPHLLAYLTLNDRCKGYIVPSVHPRHVVLYSGHTREGIDKSASELNVRAEKLAKHIADGKKGYASLLDLLAQARRMTNALVASTAGTETQSDLKQLLEMLRDASASAVLCANNFNNFG
jgi:hypothetical protein